MVAVSKECLASTSVEILPGIDLSISIPKLTAVLSKAKSTISFFVGRILDWHKEHFPDKDYEQDDPGVKFVKNVYFDYKDHQVKTIIMGASFRNIDQITELAGCDKLTISPALLEELAKNKKKLPCKLDFNDSTKDLQDWQEIKEPDFRKQLNEDSMATEKLAEGICLFSKDAEKLEELIRTRLESHSE